MKQLFVFLALLGASHFLHAQVDPRIAKESAGLSTVAQYNLPPLDNKALLEAELERRGPGIAPRFAETVKVSIDAHRDGTWEYLSNGNALWRMRITSAGAKSLNLGFTEYYMPAGGTMILYSPDYERVLGPFSPADNETHDQLWTPILDGDDLIIEVQVPQARSSELRLKLSYVNHDFIGFGNMSVLSGSCNLDVICGEDDGWEIVEDYRDIIQSVAVISTGGSTFCTGFLVNNTRQDCAPLFMTAFHCGINAGNAPSLVTYWNYQNSFCRQPFSPASGAPGDGLLNDFNTGAIYRAGYQPSDFVIVEMDDPISETAEAFFAGWSAESVSPTSAIAVHHPNTEEKRISFENDPLFQSNYFQNTPNPNGTHVRVEDWDVGTTEPGSSGSPLFDQNKRVVGQLHGGGAACGNNDPDWYGAISVSWEGGGTPNTRLKDWLDPDNTGVLVLDGRSQMQCSFFVEGTPAQQSLCLPGDVEFTLQVSENFLADVTLSLLDVPAGVVATFSANPVAPGGSATLSLTNLGGLAPGTYTIQLEGTDGTETTTADLTLQIFDAPPATPQQLEPADASASLPASVNLVWEALPLAQGYALQVSEDAGFANLLVDLVDLSDGDYLLTGLSANTTYFWRVQASNLCGEGDWSGAYSFSIGNITCNEQASVNVPVFISPSGVNTVESGLFFGAPGVISDVNVVDLIGTHTWISDLTVELISPQGTVVTLFDDVCGELDDFNVNFDDDGNGAAPCPITDGGTYVPASPLAALNGQNAQGVWILRITDNFNQDGGSLDSWGLEICLIPEASISSTIEQAVVCDDELVEVQLLVSSGFGGPVQLSAAGLPAGANAVFSVNPAQPGETVDVTIDGISGTFGAFQVLFSGDDGLTQADFALDLEIISSQPGAPVLGQPAEGVLDQTLPLAFGWAHSNPPVDGYLLEIATDPGFVNVVVSKQTNQNFYLLLSGLDAGTFYFWRVTGTNTCGTVVSNAFYFGSEGTSATTEPAFQGLEISPNPSEGHFNIAFSTFTQEALLMEVYTVNGQLVRSWEEPSGMGQLDLDLSGAPAGVYLLKMRTNRGVYTRRLVVQR